MKGTFLTGLMLLTGITMACSSAEEGTTSTRAVGQALTSDVLSPGTPLYAPPPRQGALDQYAALMAAGEKQDAKRILVMANTPQAYWLVQGTPEQAEAETSQVVGVAAAQGTVPVLVAYNIPFRDCAQFSAGGATTNEAYLAWIDGVAQGIGDRKAVVILEPDGIGIIPYYVSFWNATYDWCQPGEADPATAANDRLQTLHSAILSLKSKPNVAVYLDGTHAAWLGANEAANRLKLAGIDDADGFFVNVSNYRLTSDSLKFGEWVSSCLASINGYAAQAWWSPSWGCPNQYVQDPKSGEWYADFSEENVAAVDAAYAAVLAPGWLGPFTPTTRFVIDTSRNGQGPWKPPPGQKAKADPQDWCNPPERGLGLRPGADTGHPLADAYLWVKIPGESDGQCNRWDPPGSPDPMRGYVDPPAGAWFPEQALELVHHANPRLVVK